MSVAISLFDYTGAMLEPWAEAGFDCYAVDIQHRRGAWLTETDGVRAVHHDLTTPWLPPCDRSEIAFVAAFPPCDHLAVSGARWFKGKGLRRLADAVRLFATAAEFCEWAGAPYMIENPVSTISTYWRKPDHTFSPEDYTAYEPRDNYTKKTCLWVGNGFVMPEPRRDDSLGEPDDRIHRAAPGPERANFRSATPRGFARAVFEANARTTLSQRLRNEAEAFRRLVGGDSPLAQALDRGAEATA